MGHISFRANLCELGPCWTSDSLVAVVSAMAKAQIVLVSEVDDDNDHPWRCCLQAAKAPPYATSVRFPHWSAAYSLFERKQWRGLAEAHHRSPDQIIAERPSGRNVSSAAEQSPPMHPNPASHSLPGEEPDGCM